MALPRKPSCLLLQVSGMLWLCRPLLVAHTQGGAYLGGCAHTGSTLITVRGGSSANQD